MVAKKNLEGMTFGRLFVESPAPNRGMRAYWNCRCVCGNQTVVQTSSLTLGHTTSCGCKRNEGHVRHGHARRGAMSSTFAIWSTMKARCLNPRKQHYNRYGGRGITFCERWNNFDNFLADMGERPSGLTLDRINNDGNYEPENCRWATRLEQARNKSKKESYVE